MELVGTAINAAVVAAVGLILGWLGKGRIDRLEQRLEREVSGLRRDMNELRSGLLGDMHGLRGELHGRMDRLEERMVRGFDAIRSDLTRVALAVGVRPDAGGAQAQPR